VWQAIAYVSSGVSLVAFLAAVAAWFFKSKSEERERLIRTANEADRASLVRNALEFFQVETAGLTKEQQFKLAIEQVYARTQRFRVSAASICFVALVAAGVAAFAIAHPQQETKAFAPPGPTVRQDSATQPPRNEPTAPTPPGPAEREYAEVIRLRLEDLAQAARNVGDLVAQVKAGNIEQPGPLNRINDLNNNLGDLWLRIAGYGLGADPYLDNIFLSESGFSQAHRAPDYGVTAVPQTMGIPRLYKRFLESSERDPHSRELKEHTFAAIVHDYGNPSIYPHKDFYERAYSQYRNGNQLQTAQFKDDLDRINLWLKTLAANLDKAKQLVVVER
jgi:hypothetical protein